MNIFADNCLNLQPSRSELRPYRKKEIISRIGHNLCRVLIQDFVPVTHPVVPKKPFWVRPGNISEEPCEAERAASYKAQLVVCCAAG